MSQDDLNKTIKWFIDTQIEDHSRKENVHHFLIKKSTRFATYCIEDKFYCGPGAIYLIDGIPGIKDGDSKMATGFRELVDFFEDDPKKVTMQKIKEWGEYFPAYQ